MSKVDPRLVPARFFRFFVKRRDFEHETALFLLVSLIDFFMTYSLLMRRSESRIEYIESNPVARFFLDHWGMRGLLWFKLAAVMFVVLITILVSEKRPAAARGILLIGTVATASVVIYSLVLLTRHTGLS